MTDASSTGDEASAVRRRQWVPSGTTPVAVGLVINGLCTYLFLSVPARAGNLDPTDYAVFSALWFAVYLIGPGLYLPLEQELARRIAAARATGDSGIIAARRGLEFVLVTSSVIGAALLAGSGPLADAAFHGRQRIVAVLVLAVLGTGLIQWAKGWLAGVGSFGRYGSLVAVEGLVRALWVGAAVAVGAGSVVIFVSPVALAPMVAVVVVMARVRPRVTGSARRREDSIVGAVGTLVVAQLGAQLLMNGVPLAVAVLARDTEADLVGRIGAAVVLARTPLFLFQAVQASLLPGLADTAARGDLPAFTRTVRTVTAGLAVAGAAAVAGGAVLGPFATAVLFGADFEVSSGVFAALVLSAVVVVLALVQAQALIALGVHRLVAVGWVMGAAAFVAALARRTELEARVLTAGVAGPLVALVLLGLLVRHELRSRAPRHRSV